MPKEVIHPSVPVDVSDGATIRTAEVVWQPDGWVQLVTRTEVYESEQAVTGDSVATDLDRAQINKLIRALRRARNQAYGADE
jgi:hypothetical protein